MSNTDHAAVIRTLLATMPKVAAADGRRVELYEAAKLREHVDALAAKLDEAEARVARLHRYASMLDAQAWRMSRGPLGRSWATEVQAREREKYGVSDEFDFTGDLDDDPEATT